jgi:hypothetical protein
MVPSQIPRPGLQQQIADERKSKQGCQSFQD